MPENVEEKSAKFSQEEKIFTHSNADERMKTDLNATQFT
jgi:hypothetical protein